MTFRRRIARSLRRLATRISPPEPRKQSAPPVTLANHNKRVQDSLDTVQDALDTVSDPGVYGAGADGVVERLSDRE